MWNIDSTNLTEIHFDLTNICQAECPDCSRATNPKVISNKTVLSLDLIKERATPEKLPRLNRVTFCGTWGDPMSYPYIIELIEHFCFVNVITLVTNGALGSTRTWNRLATFKNLKVNFSIDGLEDTNEIYRKKVMWHKLQENVKTFISNGGHANWVFINFPWNEHQINQAKQKAVEQGFKEFKITHSQRKSNKNKFQGKNTYDSLEHIQCIVQDKNKEKAPYEKNSIYVLHNGLCYPCCYMGASQSNLIGEAKVNNWLKMSGGEDNISLHKNEFNDILQGEFFEIIQESWSNPDNSPLGSCNACIQTCRTKKKLDKVESFTVNA